MGKQEFVEYGMWAFVLAVIVAGFFGPWMMSLLISPLAALCLKERYHDNARAPRS